MSAKQITDLSPADSFDEGDLLFIRKTGLGTDRNINYTNFVRSIGGSFVYGYVAEEDVEGENKIILNHSSGMSLNKYYNGMKISFVSPITSTDKIQIKIANLEPVELQNLISKDPTEITQGDYIEAIYLMNEEGQEAFYCTNNYITNPRLPAATEGPQNQPEPQPAPVPMPVAPEQRNVIVTVGKGGDQTTINEAIAQLEQQYSEVPRHCNATIKLKSGHIIKEQIEIYKKDLSWVTLTSEDDEVALDISYLNKGQSGRYSFLYVTQAKSINLKLKLTGTGSFDINNQHVISLIYLGAKSELNIDDSKFSNFLCGRIIETHGSMWDDCRIEINNTKFEAVEPYIINTNGNNQTTCISLFNSELIINDCIIEGEFASAIRGAGTLKGNSLKIINHSNHRYPSSYVCKSDALKISGVQERLSDIILTNVEIFGYDKAAYLNNSIYGSDVKLINCKFVSKETALATNSSRVHIENSYFEATDTYNYRVLYSHDDLSFNAINTTFRSHCNQAVFIDKTKDVKLVNCRLISPPNSQGLLAYGDAEITVNGGDYRASDNQSYSQNILAISKGSIIKLINSPQGGAMASDGKIIKG